MADPVDHMMLDESVLDSDDEDHQVQRSEAPSNPNPAPATRVIRRRARRACIKCHERKVRCDVVRQGQPCTNCRLDAHQCIVRMRGDSIESRAQVSCSDQAKPEPVPPSVKIVPPQVTQRDSNAFSTVSETSMNDSSRRTTFPSFQPPEYPAATSSFPFGPQSNGSTSNLGVIFSYYSSFLDSEPLSHISPDDFKFLEYKGCLHLPVRSVLDSFVYEYFLHVHPCLPILNERDFWDTYLDDGRRPRQRKPIPLFVLRAMMFSSCSYVPLKTIHAMGFESYREARTCLYHRAKLLYDFGTTSNPIARSQGALLLTYFSSENEQHANTSWLRIAIQFAITANAHLYHQSFASDEDRQTHKRLWWCCILRDRILPLGVRRSIQITEENFDFSQPMLSEEDLEPEFDHSRVYDSDTKRCLARVLQAQLELAVALTNVISLVYPAKHFSIFNEVDGTYLKNMPARIQRCRDELDQWNNRVKDSRLTFEPWQSKHESVVLYSDLTQMYYHSARTALYHHEACLLQTSPAGTQEVVLQRLKEIGTELYAAIASISENVGELVQLGIARYLPVSAVAYMALPLILNSIDVQAGASGGFVSNSKRRQLRVYNEAFDLCRSRYTGVSQASAFISRTIATARLFPPTPSPQPQSLLRITPHPSSRDANSDSSLTAPNNSLGTNWLDAFISQPKLYLRIALTIDMSLSLGRWLEAEELPKRLQIKDVVAAPTSITRMPTTPGGIDFRREAAAAATASQVALVKAAAREKQQQRQQQQYVNLDYFELGERRSPEDVEGIEDGDEYDGGIGIGIGSGQSLDEMLEDILSGRAYSEVYESIWSPK